MDCVDDDVVVGSNPFFQCLESWKLAEVCFFISFSLLRDGSFLGVSNGFAFEAYWPSYVQVFWFLADKLDNVFAGVSFALDYVVSRLKGRTKTKKDVELILRRA
jgi:hypothetical protein